MSSVAPHQLFITVVHGTWPDGVLRTLLGMKRRNYWFDEGSSFFTRLSAALDDIPHRIRSLPWCGENSVYKRDNAAHHLANELAAEHNEHPQATQLVARIVTEAILSSAPFTTYKSARASWQAAKRVQILLS
jgi:hypothetical protein